MQQFENVISLGHFCGPAMELERIGLRSGSYPFDWIGTTLQNTLELIDNNFEDFLRYDLLSQHVEKKSLYKNDRYGFITLHDFSKYEPLSSQIEAVQEKFNRRIAKFYSAIKKPTLFVRYIYNQAEANYVASNYDQILAVIRRFNEKNFIVFVCHDDVVSNVPYMFPVPIDEGDTLARRFLEKSAPLMEYLCSVYPEDKRDENLRHNAEKKKKSRKLLVRLRKKFRFLNKFRAEYQHDRTYENNEW